MTNVGKTTVETKRKRMMRLKRIVYIAVVGIMDKLLCIIYMMIYWLLDDDDNDDDISLYTRDVVCSS